MRNAFNSQNLHDGLYDGGHSGHDARHVALSPAPKAQRRPLCQRHDLRAARPLAQHQVQLRSARRVIAGVRRNARERDELRRAASPIEQGSRPVVPCGAKRGRIGGSDGA